MRLLSRKVLAFLSAAILGLLIFNYTGTTEKNGLDVVTAYNLRYNNVKEHGDVKDSMHKTKSIDDANDEFIGNRRKTGNMDLKQVLQSYVERMEAMNITYHGHDLLKDPVYDFDPHFKNPCWYENDGAGESTLRCLPYVFIIGVKKCGTSDLYSRLSSHPDFVNPGFKEAQFFARGRFRNKGNPKEYDNIEKYVEMFDNAASIISTKRTQGYNNMSITGEASPSNLHLNSHWQHLPGNENLDEPKYVIVDYIHHFLPKAKIIVSFRDPVERLYSDYYHEYGNLRPTHSPNPREFHDIVVRGLDLYRQCFASRTVRSCVYDHHLYDETKIQIQLGIYYIFWQDMLRLYPRDQILVLQNKDLKEKEKTMTTVYDFLGLRKLTRSEMDAVVELTEVNTMERHHLKRIPMMSATQEMLYQFYEPFNINLAALTENNKFLFRNSKNEQSTASLLSFSSIN